MKKRGVRITTVLVVVIAAGFLAYRTWASGRNAETSDQQTATVQRGSLAATLSAVGNTRSGQSAVLVWKTSGRVDEVTLKPGSLVEEGQLLAALDPTTLSNDMIQAKQELIEAQQALDDLLNSRLRQAQALQAVEDAQEALDSLKQKAAEEASQAQLALAQAQEALEEAQKNRDKMNYPHTTNPLVIEKAQTDYLLAKEAYKEALKAYNKVARRSLLNPERVEALNRLVAAEQNMKTKFATYNWYLLGYSDQEIAQADAELAVAKANLEAAQAKWERLKDGTTQAAIALAEATLNDALREWERVKDGPSEEELAAAQAAVEAAQTKLNQAQLMAPFAGTITEVNVKTGDLVSAGDAAFRIDDLTAIYIDLQISEVDLASLKVGQQATVELDAIPDKVYSGEVTEIGMIGTVSQGVVNYPVTVRVTDADEYIRPGMTASVTIILEERQDVLIVPNKAIRTINGQQIVTVLFEGQQITLPVQVGLTSDSMSEIISEQLREGDVVLLYGSTSTTSVSGSQGDVFRPAEGFGVPMPGGMP